MFDTILSVVGVVFLFFVVSKWILGVASKYTGLAVPTIIYIVVAAAIIYFVFWAIRYFVRRRAESRRIEELERSENARKEESRLKYISARALAKNVFVPFENDLIWRAPEVGSDRMALVTRQFQSFAKLIDAGCAGFNALTDELKCVRKSAHETILASHYIAIQYCHPHEIKLRKVSPKNEPNDLTPRDVRIVFLPDKICVQEKGVVYFYPPSNIMMEMPDSIDFITEEIVEGVNPIHQFWYWEKKNGDPDLRYHDNCEMYAYPAFEVWIMLEGDRVSGVTDNFQNDDFGNDNDNDNDDENDESNGGDESIFLRKNYVVQLFFIKKKEFDNFVKMFDDLYGAPR